MTYKTISMIANDPYLRPRLTAASAEQQKTRPYDNWVAEHIWELAATPGWATAWESALAAGVENPGDDEGVITDMMILSAVQPME
jgi:hypothetical protein